MNLELVTIGTELLLGHTVDTNGAELARALGAIGLRIVRRTSIPDRAEAIDTAVREALARTGAVITTGGLGPTRDDITKKVVADIFAAPLEFNDEVWQRLLERFAKLGRVPAASNRSQAEVPRGATVLSNRWGTAPGLWLETDLGLVVMLPGVPHEMRMLLEHELIPRLTPRGAGRAIRSLLVRTTGIPESTLAERLGDVEDRIAPLTLAYLPGVEGVDLRLTAWDGVPDDADAQLRRGAELLRERAGEFVYGTDSDDLAAVVLNELRDAELRLAVAESCTGGLLGARLTEIPGSSDVFLGGIIAYHNDVKRQQLGVPTEILATHGAVSEATARSMAIGIRRALGADLAVAITGVAGPGGGSPEKPVGTVWLACAMADDVEARRIVFAGSRSEVRVRAAQAALFLMLRKVKQP